MNLRIDKLLVVKKMVASRTHAQYLIAQKKVLVNKRFVFKASEIVNSNANISILKNHFFSRGAIKFQFALKYFKIEVKNKIGLDVGASTGGFTKVLLDHKIKKVYAIDVGFNQIAYQLRIDPKIVVFEKYNFKYAKKEDFEDEIDFICVDVSFISIVKLLTPIYKILKLNSYAILLIKPQFEISKDVEFKGKVKKYQQVFNVLKKIIAACQQNYFNVLDLIYSPILGHKKNNLEFFILLQKNQKSNKILNQVNEEKINKIIQNALIFLKTKLI